MSRCVWALEEEHMLSALSEVTEPDARRWIFTIMEKVSSSDFIRALVTLWSIWQAIHENIFQSPAGTHLFVDRFISEISASRPTQQNQVRAPTLIQCWLPPPPGHCKIKVDGATTKSARRKSVGVICRAIDGSFMGASAICFEGVSDPASLEALACREALALAPDLMQTQVVVASNCKEVVSNISEGNGGTHAHIIREIKQMESEFQSCSFIFECRTTNIEAHSLAKYALSLSNGRHVWLLQPPNLRCIPQNILE